MSVTFERIQIQRAIKRLAKERELWLVEAKLSVAGEKPIYQWALYTNWREANAWVCIAWAHLVMHQGVTNRIGRLCALPDGTKERTKGCVWWSARCGANTVYQGFVVRRIK